MPTPKNLGELDDSGVWDLAQIEDKVVQPTQWLTVGTDTYKAMPFTRPFLSPGVYTVSRDNNDNQPIFIKKPMHSDETIIIKDSFAASVIKECRQFWGLAPVFKENGFLHRRGYLLYGPQGTGKSSIVREMVEDVIARGGVVLLCGNPAFFSPALKTLRQVEPNRPVICVFEDIDAIIGKYGEDEILAILDGTNQVDHVINVATTNYPERLDKRIISRPRRFDRVHKVLAPNEATRTAYLKAKLPKGYNLAKWTKATKDLSFAALAEAIVSVICLGNDFDETINILRNMEKGHPSSEDFGGEKNGLGFGVGDHDDEDGCGDAECNECYPVRLKSKPKFS